MPTYPAERMTGGQALARQLEREGVECIFGLPGDQTMHALDGLYEVPSIRFITTRHEQGTTYMADGYARAAGRPGVAFVVPGVGVYNAGAGLATAWAASTGSARGSVCCTRSTTNSTSFARSHRGSAGR